MISIIIKAINTIYTKSMLVWNWLKVYSFGSKVQLSNWRTSKFNGSFYLRMGKGSSLIIGDKFTLVSGLCKNPIIRNIKSSICLERNAKMTIGDNVGISGSCIWSHKSITIGNNVNIGGDCLIVDSDCHSLDYTIRASDNDQIQKCDLPIVIEDNVLIGTRSIVLKGVTIGARSIIGAGSVVTKSIPADCIAAGNPCRVIRTLK